IRHFAASHPTLLGLKTRRSHVANDGLLWLAISCGEVKPTKSSAFSPSRWKSSIPPHCQADWAYNFRARTTAADGSQVFIARRGKYIESYSPGHWFAGQCRAP